jgi:hypothetical protein
MLLPVTETTLCNRRLSSSVCPEPGPEAEAEAEAEEERRAGRERE